MVSLFSGDRGGRNSVSRFNGHDFLDVTVVGSVRNFAIVFVTSSVLFGKV